MLEVKNNSVNLTRGDCCALKVDIIDTDGSPYTLQEGDVLKFTLRKKVGSEDILLQKHFDEDILNLVSADTVDLNFGAYVYDVVLITYTGDVFTIIPTSIFNILQEVHN